MADVRWHALQDSLLERINQCRSDLEDVEEGAELVIIEGAVYDLEQAILTATVEEEDEEEEEVEEDEEDDAE
jgi:hypothetical protein